MNFIKVYHLIKFAMRILEWNTFMYLESTDINVKRTHLYCLSIQGILLHCHYLLRTFLGDVHLI